MPSPVIPPQARIATVSDHALQALFFVLLVSMTRIASVLGAADSVHALFMSATVFS